MDKTKVFDIAGRASPVHSEKRDTAELLQLEDGPSYPGYCHQCSQPRLVKKLTMPGWDHFFYICSSCLRRLADDIDRAGQQPAEDPYHIELARREQIE